MPATEQHPATVLLVDDHPLMRKGLRALLESEPGLAVAGERGHTRAQLVGSTDLENQTLRAGIDCSSLVNELLQRLLALPPIPLHLVLITRRDPPLPLVNLRAKGQMNEIRMSDLDWPCA